MHRLNYEIGVTPRLGGDDTIRLSLWALLSSNSRGWRVRDVENRIPQVGVGGGRRVLDGYLLAVVLVPVLVVLVLL